MCLMVPRNRKKTYLGGLGGPWGTFSLRNAKMTVLGIRQSVEIKQTLDAILFAGTQRVSMTRSVQRIQAYIPYIELYHYVGL